MKSNQKTALVIGATGIIGRAITQALAHDGKWHVVALSRSGESVAGAEKALTVDLLNQEESRRQLASLSQVTHLFYAAYIEFEIVDIQDFNLPLLGDREPLTGLNRTRRISCARSTKQYKLQDQSSSNL